ncbi:uncharacterized protein [Oscarella lobularis]|uniref:uncharacterized protein n=1 Tax=Oscarella lobularis TaxID=121494 RepID=UPI003313CC5C
MNQSVVFCRACLVVNEASSTMMLRGAQLESDGDKDSDGFSSGIVNRGLVVVELISNYSVRWNVANIGGRIQIFGVQRSQHRLTMTLHSRWVNDGSIRLYAVSLRFSHSNVATRSENGTWEVHSYPATSDEYALGSWKNLLAQYDHDARRNRSRYHVDVFIDQSMTFYNVTAFGCVRMYVDNRPATVRFVGDLNLGDCGELRLRRHGRVKKSSVLFVSDVARFCVDFIVVTSGWTLNLSTRGKVAIRRRLVVETNAAATIGSDVFASGVNIGSVYLSNDARFDVFNRNVTIDSVFRTNGTVNLTESTLKTKDWHYDRGFLIGSRALLHVLARGRVASRVPLAVDGVGLKIEASPIESSRRGVLAEYFQYRVDTDLTSQINSLSHFPGDDGKSNSLPRDFDDGSYRPNAVQFLSSFDRLPRRSGSSPLALKPDYVRTDITSPHSFTLNYAARLWSFLVVDETGFYRFRFLTGAGLRVRLWIDDRIVFTSRRSLRYLYKSKPHITESFELRQGVSRLRFDFIQERLISSDYDNALLVDYSGPSFDWRPIPMDKLFRRYALPDGTSQPANPNFDVEQFEPTTSYLRVNSLIVAKNGADLTVSETGVVEVGDEFLWISHSTGLQSNVVNRGRFVDVEANEVAPSSIFVNYYDDNYVSNGNSTSVTWINSNGGLWDDETNWYPRRVPRADDDAYVTMDGDYRFMIRNHSRANALSLTLGSGSSDSRPELVVGHFARADIGSLDVNTPITTIRGRLSVQFLTFRGQTITGGGELHVARRFFFARSSYTKRYFSRINVTVSKLFDVESRLYDDDVYHPYFNRYDAPHLYCDRCYVINEIGSTFQTVDLHLFVIGNEVSSESDGFRRGVVNYGLVVLELVPSTIMAWDVRNYGEFVVVTKTYYESKSLDYRGSFVNYNATRIYLSSVVFRETSTVISAHGSVWKTYGYPLRRKGAPSFPEGEQLSGQWRRFIDDVYQNVATLNDSTVVWNARFAIEIDVKNALSSSTFSFFRFETYGYVNFRLSNSVDFADGLYMDRHGDLSLIRRTFIDQRHVAAIGNLVTGQAFVGEGWNLAIGKAKFYRRSTIDDDAIVTAKKGRESTLDFYDELVVNGRGVLNVVDASTNCHSDVAQAGTIRIGNGRMSVDGRCTFEAGEFVAANGTIRLRGGFDIVGISDKVFTNVRIRIDAPKDGIPSTLQTGFSSSSLTLAGDGLIFGRESVTVDVCETCQFHVLDPIRWVPDPILGVVTTFVNSGSLVRRGRPGTAVIYGHYVGNEENFQTTAKSLVVFRSLPEGKTATWTNREGGSWNDSSNWNPRRVPLSTDVVRIALPGSYRITIPDGLVVKVTVLYAESADVEWSSRRLDLSYRNSMLVYGF